MNKQESDVLYCLYNEPFINQRILAEMSGHSLGVVNRSVKNLIGNGYLDDHVQLTAKARAEFALKKPENAIILAAGFGMRMVPIHTSVPKALLEVNGERLIDRLIRQLQETGIREIIVIVGFMVESFEYLLDEPGVELIYNPEYAVKNNISSLYLAADRISNTYIVPCDLWCDRNPFHRHELYSWYMVSDLVDEASDVRVNRKMELVKVPESAGGNGMTGICYLTKEQGALVREHISAYVLDAAYNHKFWEEALYQADRMIVQARVVHASDVVEINTYEQLRDLDADSDHLKSDALDVISKVLHCDTENITDIEVLKKGMTNRSFLFHCNNRKYIMRIPGEGTGRLINRRQEADVYRIIRGKGLCDEPVYINPDNGYKITEFLENVRVCDKHNTDDIKLCMEKLRSLHHMNLQTDHTFDLFGQIMFYESLRDDTLSVYPDYEQTRERVFSLREYIDAREKQWCLAHIDAVYDNFLFYDGDDGSRQLQLTDWEYAGMQDPHLDIAMFAVYALYNKQQTDWLVDLYFEGRCEETVRVKIYCYMAACGLLWSNWCEYKRTLGVEFGEYSLRQYRYAKDFYRYAAEKMTDWNRNK